MGNHWTCPQGHRWELPSKESTPEGESLACPICGSQVKDPPPPPEPSVARSGLVGRLAAALADAAPGRTVVESAPSGPSAAPARLPHLPG
jgi:hypothetical protein